MGWFDASGQLCSIRLSHRPAVPDAMGGIDRVVELARQAFDG